METIGRNPFGTLSDCEFLVEWHQLACVPECRKLSKKNRTEGQCIIKIKVLHQGPSPGWLHHHLRCLL